MTVPGAKNQVPEEPRDNADNLSIRLRETSLPTPSEYAGAERRLHWPWLLSDHGILVVASMVAALGLVGMIVMLLIATNVPGDGKAQIEIDAIKYGLGFVAAGGAAAALLLGVRRQQLSEHAHRLELRKQQHSETDAADRRVTELYTKAAEQLGSIDAAVRLAGLYALERLARANPGQRQTIVDVLCAYLRMPYSMPGSDAPELSVPGRSEPLAELPLTRRDLAIGNRDSRQELQVRLTAQRILISHLQQPFAGDAHPNYRARVTPTDFWPDIDLDLSGALLIDWYLRNATVRDVNFSGSRFHGRASFVRTKFLGRAIFENVHFMHSASLADTVFASTEDFGISFFGAHFSEDVSFDGAEFIGSAQFGHSEADDDISFARARFRRAARFYEAHFHKRATFRKCGFASALFVDVKFHQTAVFEEADFTGDATFDRAVLQAARISQNAASHKGPPSWEAGLPPKIILRARRVRMTRPCLISSQGPQWKQ